MKGIVKSFYNAFQGIFHSLRGRNMKIHFVAATLTLILGIWLEVDRYEWFAILFCSALVITAEMLNSALEQLADTVRDEMKLSYVATRWPRDMAAGAVLVSAIMSAAIGLMIFLPKLAATL